MILAGKQDINTDYVLFGRWKVCTETGPSLCVGRQSCWSKELSVLPAIFCRHNKIIGFLLISSSLFPWFSLCWMLAYDTYNVTTQVHR